MPLKSGFPFRLYFSLPSDKIDTQGRFNPYLDYKVFMVPALMAQLLMMLCGFLPALNIVSEKNSEPSNKSM